MEYIVYSSMVPNIIVVYDSMAEYAMGIVWSSIVWYSRFLSI